MSGSASRRTPLLVLAAAVVVGGLAAIGFYTPGGAAKAREREARLAAAQERSGESHVASRRVGS